MKVGFIPLLGSGAAIPETMEILVMAALERLAPSDTEAILLVPVMQRPGDAPDRIMFCADQNGWTLWTHGWGQTTRGYGAIARVVDVVIIAIDYAAVDHAEAQEIYDLVAKEDKPIITVNASAIGWSSSLEELGYDLLGCA